MTGLARGLLLLAWMCVASGAGVVALWSAEALSSWLAGRAGGRHRR